jgi:hypothetical protein
MAYKKGVNGLGLGTLGGLSTYNSSIMTTKSFGQSEYHQFENAEVMAIDLNPEKPENVGRVQFRFISQSGIDSDSLSWAFPLVPYYRMYPVIGELVVIADFNGRYYWLSILNVLNTVNNNLQSNITERNIKTQTQGDVNQYKESQASGIPTDENEKSGSPGETFINKRLKIGILSPNEGDTIIEGRYANSIRLGNNPESNLPNIKISVRDLLDDFAIDKEDLDKHSCIFITTDEILTFNPIGIPISDVNNPPSEYNGKQIYITSDRLIFSAKLNEILMFSNKLISFASLDNFSVDTDKKIITNSKDNTEINTQQMLLTTSVKNTQINSKEQFLVQADKEVKIKALKVMIGTIDANEPLVLGNKWKEAMLTLIDIVMNHKHPTGTGISGPLLVPDKTSLIDLKTSVSNKEQLSDDNFTTKKN